MSVIPQNFPLTSTSNSGVLQHMKNNDQTKNINFQYSSQLSGCNASNVLTLDDNYFITETNKSNDANFMIINLFDRIIDLKGYIIRSDSRSDYFYLRSWKLYGSLLGSKWKEIHSKQETDELKGGNVGRYHLSKGVFNRFKVVQTGPCYGQIDDNKYRLRIAYIDFFGCMTISKGIGAWKTCKTKQRFISFHTLNSMLMLSF